MDKVKPDDIGPIRVQTNPLWDRDDIQFARLLLEIKMVLLSDDDIGSLASSMDLDDKDVEELFDRAEDAFDKSKAMQDAGTLSSVCCVHCAAAGAEDKHMEDKKDG